MFTTVQLVIVDGPDEGARYEFHQKEISIGSNFSNDLILNHGDVAAQHLRIFEENTEVFLEGTGKDYAIKLNGLVVSRESLHNGDELQVGPYVFHISLIQQEIQEEVAVELEETDEPIEKSPLKRPMVFLRLISIIMLLFVVYISVRFFLFKDKEKEDLAIHGPVVLPAKEVYGCKVEGNNYVDKVEFSFVAEHPKYRLKYKPGYISGFRQVQVFVNDKKLSDVPISTNRWLDDFIEVDITEELLIAGAVNIIRFDNLRNPPGTNRWGVRDVSVEEVPIPKCDVKIAQKYLQLSQEKYRERQISKSNLFDAINYIEEGQEYVIACEDLELRNLLQDTATQYRSELNEIIKRLQFNARKFLKLKDAEAAKFEFSQILEYLPDETDIRYQRAREWVEKLNFGK